MATRTAVRNLVQRFLSALSLVVVFVLSTTAPVSAKMTPFFTVAIVPAVPIAGEPMIVVVKTWSDAEHTTPAGFDAAVALDGLLVLRPARGAAADIPIPLRFEAPDEFRATLVGPSAGDWSLLAFPDRTGWGSPVVPPGYFDTLAVSVRPASDRDTRVLVVIGVAVVILAVAAVLATARRRRAGLSGSAGRWLRRPLRRPSAPGETAR